MDGELTKQIDVVLLEDSLVEDTEFIMVSLDAITAPVVPMKVAVSLDTTRSTSKIYIQDRSCKLNHKATCKNSPIKDT